MLKKDKKLIQLSGNVMKKFCEIFTLSFAVSLLAGLVLLNMASGSGPVIYSFNADGSIMPSTSLITTSGNTYYFTGNFKGCIDVYASNIMIDGNGYTLQGPGNLGFWLNRVNNVTIRNLTISNFNDAIYMTSSNNNSIHGNNLTSNHCGIESYDGSNYNIIYSNNITSNSYGITLSNSAPFNPPDSSLPGSNYNKIYLNNLESNQNIGVFISKSNHNQIYNNTITDSTLGICLSSSSDNEFFINNLVNNSQNVKVGGTISYWTGAGIGGFGFNVWDNGSAGNYWSDYISRYPNASQIDASGIGDTAYVIDANNSDRYPLMAAFDVSPTSTAPAQQQEASSSSVVTVAVASGASVAIVGVGVFYYFRKRHH